MPNPLQMLREDHQKVQTLFKQFESTENLAEKKRIADEAIKELRVHTVLEEEVFYPAVRHDGGGMVDEAMEEHRVAGMLIDELAGMRPDNESYVAKFRVLAESVRHHIQEEESEMLPKAAETRSAELERLGERMGQRRMQLMNEMEGAERTTRRTTAGRRTTARRRTTTRAAGPARRTTRAAAPTARKPAAARRTTRAAAPTARKPAAARRTTRAAAPTARKPAAARRTTRAAAPTARKPAAARRTTRAAAPGARKPAAARRTTAGRRTTTAGRRTTAARRTTRAAGATAARRTTTRARRGTTPRAPSARSRSRRESSR